MNERNFRTNASEGSDMVKLVKSLPIRCGSPCAEPVPK
jgi:hypothetical protein